MVPFFLARMYLHLAALEKFSVDLNFQTFALTAELHGNLNLGKS